MDSFPIWLSLRVALSATTLTLLTGTGFRNENAGTPG